MEIEFRNDTRDPLNVVIEPWADEISLPSDKRAVLEFFQDKISSLTVVASEGYLSIFVEDQNVDHYTFKLR